MTFKTLIELIRLVVVAVGIGVVCLMLGPFEGLERRLGLDDVQAHALGFYGMALLLYLVAPDRRRSDLSIALFGIGVLIELAQGMTGRTMSLADVCANGLGIAAAYAPGLAEQLRRQVRRHPHEAITAFRRADRRRRRAPVAAPRPVDTAPGIGR